MIDTYSVGFANSSQETNKVRAILFSMITQQTVAWILSGSYDNFFLARTLFVIPVSLEVQIR